MALDDIIAVLERVPLLACFDRDALRLLAFSGDTRRLRSDEMLFRKGDRSDGGYVVMSGSVAVGDARDGGGPMVLAGPGSLIGQMALFVRMQRPATAVARETTMLLRISPTLMRRVLEEFPAATTAMHEALAADLDSLSGGLDRVRRMLLNAAPRRGPGRTSTPGSS